MENNNNSPIDLFAKVGAVIGFIILLINFVSLMSDSAQGTQGIRIVTTGVFIAYFIATMWLAFKAKNIGQKGRWASLIVLYIITIFFSIWVGTWLKPRSAYDSMQSCNSYKIAILSPRSGEIVAQNEVIHGSYSIYPENAEIWIFTVDRELGHYRPRVVVKDNGDGTWVANPTYIGEIGETVELVPFSVSENAHILIDYYNQVGREGNEWFALTNLPSDLVECKSSIFVTVR